MHTIPDLGIPEVKPAIELYYGRQRQKVSPRFTHARLQTRCAGILDRWGSDHGRIGTEWRFYFIDRPGAPSSLVPDVAYISFARLAEDALEEAERPTIAPDIAVEILSPDDRIAHVREKIELYLEYGTAHVIIIDPKTASLKHYLAEMPIERTFRGDDIAVIADGLVFDLKSLFSARTP